MRILFNIMTLSKGGAERVVNVLANEFIKKNDVKIICNMHSNIDYQFDDKIEIDFLSKATPQNKFLRKFGRFSIAKILKLKKKVNDYNPDIILSFLPEPSLRLLIVKKMFNNTIKAPIIVAERNDPRVEYKNTIFNYAMKQLYKHANGFVFQTKEAKDYFKDIINCKSTIILNPIDSSFINHKIDFEKKKNEIVAVGRLEKQKNYPLLLNSFEKFIGKGNNYDLKIFGTGSEEQNIRKIIKEKHLDNNATLMGNVSNIKDYIRNATVFVLTSDYEGLPNALIEAMAMGLPCISTDCPCGGPKSLIKNNINGILIPVGDEEKLCEALEKITKDKALQKSIAHNAQKIIEEVKKETITEKWLNFIHEVKQI